MLKRQKGGIAVVKSKSKHLDHPQLNLSTLSKQQKADLEANNHTWNVKSITGVKFMEILGLKKNTFYKIIGEYENLI